MTYCYLSNCFEPLVLLIGKHWASSMAAVGIVLLSLGLQLAICIFSWMGTMRSQKSHFKNKDSMADVHRQPKAPRKLKQEDLELEASLGNLVRACLKINKKG